MQRLFDHCLIVISRALMQAGFSETQHTLNLRGPLFIAPLLTDSVNVSILYTDTTPSESSPYTTVPTLSLDAVYINYARYVEGCGQISEECLRAAGDLFQNLERASETGVTCLPRERSIFITDLYKECVREYWKTMSNNPWDVVSIFPLWNNEYGEGAVLWYYVCASMDLSILKIE